MDIVESLARASAKVSRASAYSKLCSRSRPSVKAGCASGFPVTWKSSMPRWGAGGSCVGLQPRANARNANTRKIGRMVDFFSIKYGENAFTLLMGEVAGWSHMVETVQGVAQVAASGYLGRHTTRYAVASTRYYAWRRQASRTRSPHSPKRRIAGTCPES